MWVKLLFFLLLVSLCGVLGDGEIDMKKDVRQNCDKNDNCDVTSLNDDDPKNYYELCHYSDDVECVQKFFGDFSDCTIIHHPDNKPIYRKKHVNFLPNINSTLITTRDRLTNTEGKIVAFYMNKKTNNLIMAVDFTNYTIEAKKLYVIVNRRGKEPAVAGDYANGTHTFTATAIIPLHDGKIDMNKAKVSSYLPNGYPEFYFGPKLTNSSDPDVARAVAGIYADTPTAAMEYFLTEGPGFFLAYFQKYICDFGIPLSN